MIEPPGTQLWTDIRWRDGWRVQRRWGRGSARLLDPEGRTILRGSAEACERSMHEAVPHPDPAPHLVVLLHGLGRTRRSLARIDSALSRAGFTTARLDYPSTRRTVEEHAAQVAELLDHAPAFRRLSFVGHSLGALVIRRLFGFQRSWRASAARIVMLAPPNQGASLATQLERFGLLAPLLGPSFTQIAAGHARDLPVPDVPFAVFAGDAVGGVSDGLVEVEETKLPGMAEHHTVGAVHTFIMNHPRVVQGVVSFLRAAPGGA